MDTPEKATDVNEALTSSNEVNGKNMLKNKYLEIILVVALYWFVSITLVFVNKELLTSDTFKLDAPVFITWYQCIVTVFLCVALKLCENLFPKFISFPDITPDLTVMRKISPLSLLFAAMIIFNNLCLKYVGVAFYYISRSLSTVFNVIFTYTILGQKTSTNALITCSVILGGYFLGVDQESVGGNLSILGVFCGVLASAFVSLNAIFTKKVMPHVDGSIWRLTYINNLNAIIIFLPVIISMGEFEKLYSFAYLYSTTFWLYMSIGGVFGFAIGYLTGLQIKVTSPLTHNISGTAKACAQTVLGCVWYHEVKSLLWWLSNAIVLLGSCAYARVRQVEMSQSSSSKPASAHKI